MARTPRQASETEWHHVMNRGARRLPVFGDDVDRKMFLGLLGDATEPRRFEVHAYALMDNHYHLLVRSSVADLSAAMRLIGGSYTRRFNDRHGLDGPSAVGDIGSSESTRTATSTKFFATSIATRWRSRTAIVGRAYFAGRATSPTPGSPLPRDGSRSSRYDRRSATRPATGSSSR